MLPTSTALRVLRRLRIVLGLFAIGASPAAASTYLYLTGEAGDRFLEGQQVFLDTSNAVFQPQLQPNGFLIDVYDGERSWSIWIEAPRGQSLAPGTYGSAVGALVDTGYFPSEPPAPHLAVTGPFGCPYDSPGPLRSSGRFVVRRVIPYASYLVEAIVDFEQRCTGATGSIRGRLAFEASSLQCTLNPDGTACDDFDPCTQDDVCSGGICAGHDDVSPTCTASDQCHEAGVCDRQLGSCIAPVRAGEPFCDDGNVCTSHEHCVAGQCTGGDARDCDDGYLCTADGCDPVNGCQHTPEPGSCWIFRPQARVVVAVREPGSSERCSTRCQGFDTPTLLLQPDGGYRIQDNKKLVCGNVSTTSPPDEIGTIRNGSRGRQRLIPANLDDMSELVQCFTIGVRPDGYRQWVREKNGALRGRFVLRAQGRPYGSSLSVSVKQRFTAVPGLLENGLPNQPPAPDPYLQWCSALSTYDCVRRTEPPRDAR